MKSHDDDPNLLSDESFVEDELNFPNLPEDDIPRRSCVYRGTTTRELKANAIDGMRAATKYSTLITDDVIFMLL
jgi:hypothetical protein